MQTAREAPRRRRWAAYVPLGLLIAFTGFLAVVIAIDWLQGVSTYFWQESTCTVEASRVVDRPDGVFELLVEYRYHHRGESFTGDRYSHGYTGSSSASDAHRLAARYAPGETVPCWIDDDEPWKAYLKRANLWRGLWVFVPLLFLAVGIGGLYLVRNQDRLAEPPPAGPTPARTRSGPLRTTVMVTILFGSFFLFGFGLFIPFFVWPVLQVVDARSWAPVDCEIVSSGVRSHPGDDSTTYSVEALYRYRYEGQEYVSSRYRFMGGSSSGYEGKAKAVAEIPAGERIECYVDPDDPYEAVIDRGLAADFLFGLIPLVFGVIGAVGLFVAIGMSMAARRAAAQPSWMRPAPAAATEPLSGPLALEPRSGPFGKLGLALFLALFWNGIVSVFLWQLISGWRTGSFDWFLALFLTPFVLIGLLLLSAVPYSLLALVNPRPRLRLSSAVLRPDESVQLDWSFRGAASRIRSLEIVLEGSRTETSTDGSSRRRSSRVFRTIDVAERPEGVPLDFGSAGIRLPHDVEPTVAGVVSWKLRLHGRIDYWPDVMDEYEVRVVGRDHE